MIWHQSIPWLDPLVAADHLCDLPGMVFLDSAMPHDFLGRYSFVAADPFGIFRVDQRGAWWNDTPIPGPPLASLRQQLAAFAIEKIPDLPPFQGGAIGIIGYDFSHWLEDTLTSDGAANDQMIWGFYDVVLAWDHQTRECIIFSTGWPDHGPAREKRAYERQNFFLDCLRKPSRTPHQNQTLNWRTNFDRDRFITAVEQVKKYILAGDIYQANLARQMIADLPDDFSAWDFYQSLRHHNPAPFAAYLALGERIIASSSPERFLRLTGCDAETRPIKGTIRRSENAAEDQNRAETLMQSAKDRAENIMIVDLLRNDFSRLCRPHSVQVPVLCGLESYAGLHHLVSVITGQLAENSDGIDLIAACFPGGSITGAPKIRAMQIIAEIEQSPRGAYCGSIGWIGFDGDLDLNIAIRTLVFEDHKVMFHSGGGMTALSDPAAEFDEVLTKSHRILQAF